MHTESAIKGKADQVMDRVIGWIKSGKIAVGEKLPAERELSGTLGVSLLTVNKAMSRLEDLGLISRSAGRGTHVTKIPANDAIAVICDICHLSEANHAPSTDRLIESIMESSSQKGYGPHFIVGKGEDAKSFIKSLNMKSSVWGEIKGAILMAWKEGLENELKGLGVESVVIDSLDQGFHSVLFDYVELGRIAARRIASTGAKNVCLIHNEVFNHDSFNNPLLSFEAELANLGSQAEIMRIGMEKLSIESGEAMAEELSGRLPSFESIFITNDNIAAGFAKWLSANPGKINESATLLSHSNAAVLPEIRRHFETVEFDMGAAAAASVKELSRLLNAPENSEEPSRLWLKPNLFPRNI